jgi:hypothetical protein
MISQSINAHRSRTMQNEWQKRKTEWVKTLNANLQQQVDKYRNRYYAYKASVANALGHLSQTQHATLEQHRLNYNQSMQIKKDLMTRARAGEKIEVDVQIVMYLKGGGHGSN